jgi:hypothetical protein
MVMGGGAVVCGLKNESDECDEPDGCGAAISAPFLQVLFSRQFVYIAGPDQTRRTAFISALV